MIERLRLDLEIVNSAIDDEEIRRETFIRAKEEPATLWELEDLRGDIEALILWIEQQGPSVETIVRKAYGVGGSLIHILEGHRRADTKQRRRARAKRRRGAAETKQKREEKNAQRDQYIAERFAVLNAERAPNMQNTISDELKAMTDEDGQPVYRHNVSPGAVYRVIQRLKSS